MSPSAVSPTLHLLAIIEEAIIARLAGMPDDGPPDVALVALYSAREWLLDLREREIGLGDG